MTKLRCQRGRPRAQMKERYTTMRPYGQWLAEQAFTLNDVVASVGPAAAAPPGGASANGASGSSNGASAHAANGAGAGAASEGAGVQRLLQPLKVRPAQHRPTRAGGCCPGWRVGCGVAVRQLFASGLMCGWRRTYWRWVSLAGLSTFGSVRARKACLYFKERRSHLAREVHLSFVQRARSRRSALAAACLQHRACAVDLDLVHYPTPYP